MGTIFPLHKCSSVERNVNGFYQPSRSDTSIATKDELLLAHAVLSTDHL